ncbi:hypothetical protein [Geothrix sp. PMB-07]|uniref:hypothetical protein n=1 Tax=Geothrix sp. PMB-07 TaxID=3068640 RepID=UPI002740FF4A|nr:hypothetical protein [Geothrix sp. PMB-07]WLT30660.1 hypothetical protein Q9293_13140 [Geothrix sp. PMB-07]
MKPLTRFKIQFTALGVLTLGSLAILGWGVSRVMRTEPVAQEWAGELLDRMAASYAIARRNLANEQIQQLSIVAAVTQEAGGDDLDTRMANLQKFFGLVQAQRRVAEEANRLPAKWSPVTWWTNPLTGKRTALNATTDGRLDPVAVAFVKASIDLDVVAALARERAAQDAPLSPRERVDRDLAALHGRPQ